MFNPFPFLFDILMKDAFEIIGHIFAVAGMACFGTFYFGYTVYILFAMFQAVGTQIQCCSFKSQETTPVSLGN